jgi:hypothetical protein
MASLADAFAGIESSGNPLAWNTLPGGRRSRYRGLFQFGPEQERRYGITDWTNPEQQRGAFEQHIGSLRGDLGRRLGRTPEDWELYFGHQQGPSGSHALLTAAPGTPAWQAIRRFYGSDALAQQAISGNIPRRHALYGRPADSITAQDFARMWQERFGRQGSPGAPLGAPPVMPVATADASSPLPGGPPSSTSASWLQSLGSGLMGAIAPSAQAQTLPVTPPGVPPVDEQGMQPPPSSLGLPGAAPPPVPPVTPADLPPDFAGGPSGPLIPGLLPRGTVRSLLGSFVPASPSATSVAPFGALTVTPEPGSLGHPMGSSELQPAGRDITQEMTAAGLPQAQPPPVDADAIVRGAETAAADRASQAPRPFSIGDLASNPLFLAGLSILGTAPGGNWGPNAVQAMTGATRAQREQTEYQRLQSGRAVQDRVWREAFGAGGQPNAGHPLLQGMPPEMAATIYAMGAEEGLPAAQRWQMFRGQQAEQLRILQERVRMAEGGGQQPPGTPPQGGGGDGMAVLTGDRLRSNAGLGGLLGGLSAEDETLRSGPVVGSAGVTAVPSPPPSPGARGPTVTFGDRVMTLPQAREQARRLDIMGMRSEVLEDAIKAAAATAPQEGTAERVSALLGELAGIPSRPEYSGAFSGAIGRFTGAEGGLFTNPFGAAGRAWSGDRGAEIRRTIEGTAAALAAAVKPLIRGAGEGSWSDIDQAKLDSVIGNLTLAADATSYARELENVRRRIAALMTERGLAEPTTGGQAPQSGSGFSIRRIN